MYNKYLIWETELDIHTRIILFGAGKIAKSILNRLRGKVHIIGISDTNESKARKFSDENDVEFIPKEKLLHEYNQNYGRDLILITSVSYKDEIYNELTKIISCDYVKRFEFVPEISGEIIPEVYHEFVKKNKKELEELYEAFEDMKSKCVFENVIKGRMYYDFSYFKEEKTELTYFPKDIIKVNTNEIFIDGGAYIGDTYYEFIESCSGNYDGYYRFEVEKENFEKLKETVTENEKNVLVNKGLYSRKGFLAFEKGGSGTQRIADSTSGYACPVVTLDEILTDRCTMIKLDTEGCELDILRGGEDY